MAHTGTIIIDSDIKSIVADQIAGACSPAARGDYGDAVGQSALFHSRASTNRLPVPHVEDSTEIGMLSPHCFGTVLVIAHAFEASQSAAWLDTISMLSRLLNVSINP